MIFALITRKKVCSRLFIRWETNGVRTGIELLVSYSNKGLGDADVPLQHPNRLVPLLLLHLQAPLPASRFLCEDRPQKTIDRFDPARLWRWS